MNSNNGQFGALRSRRRLLQTVLGLSLAGAVTVIEGCAKRLALLCSDPAKLSDAENSLRESLHYSEKSEVEGQMCRGCAYFASTGNGCGECKLLKGPVNPMGRCDSWSAAKK